MKQKYLVLSRAHIFLTNFAAILLKIEALLSDLCALYACSNLISGNNVTSLMHMTLNNNFTEVGHTELRGKYSSRKLCSCMPPAIIMYLVSIPREMAILSVYSGRNIQVSSNINVYNPISDL
jgi:hypothetical protein